MSFLKNVVNDESQEGQLIVICGMEGIGKTTLVCGAPNALFVPLESGGKISIPHIKSPEFGWKWTDVDNLCTEILTQAEAKKIPEGTSIIWDSATALERIIHAETLNRDTAESKAKLKAGHSMDTAHGGYGKAYTIANDIFSQWLLYQNYLTKTFNINVICTCHSFTVKMIDPSAGEYDSYDLLLHSPKNSKTYGKRELLMQAADMVGFLHEPITVYKAEGEKLARGITNKQRLLEIERSPAWAAKNRYHLHDAIVIPEENGWNVVSDAIYNGCGIDLFNRANLSTEGN
jgi:energy-coupling factor transporter ATP-binding protein EcfA2